MKNSQCQKTGLYCFQFGFNFCQFILSPGFLVNFCLSQILTNWSIRDDNGLSEEILMANHLVLTLTDFARWACEVNEFEIERSFKSTVGDEKMCDELKWSFELSEFHCVASISQSICITTHRRVYFLAFREILRSNYSRVVNKLWLPWERLGNYFYEKETFWSFDTSPSMFKLKSIFNHIY